MEKRYLPTISRISQHFDEPEQQFFVNLKENHKKRAENLEKIITPEKFD